MNKRVVFLFVLLIFISVSSVCFAFLGPELTLSPDLKEAVVYKGYRHAFDVDRSKYIWTVSDRTKIHMFDDGVFLPFANGDSYVIGEPVDKSVSRIKVKISVPYFVYETDDVVIDSPEGYVFSYCLQPSSGIYSMNYEITGKMFKAEPAGSHDVYDTIKLLKLIPVKAGKGKLTFYVNNQRLSVNVTVKDSAILPKSSSSESSPSRPVCGVVKKAVNIRSQPSSESTRVGSAGKGELLTVTHPYYTEKWHQVLFDGETCYVSSNYVDIQE